jgi:phosphoenolpyruvate---glycerone phosphotransferase subunit DhaK
LKKFLDDPASAAEDALEGMVLSRPDVLRRIPGKRIVVRADAPVRGKVALVSGAGSGHEPAHVGYVGRGMLDGAAMGDVFSAPASGDILTAIQATESGNGVLLIVPNYGGDVLNFGLAERRARESGITVERTLVNDDVAIEDEARRRGVGTAILAEKIAGAKAERGATLSEVRELAERVVSGGRSMGVALTPCTIPAVGRPTFTIPDDELELGIGIHGEPGVKRSRMMTSDQISGFLVDRIAEDLELSSGDGVAVLAQGMGGTSNMEKFIFYRDVRRHLATRNVTVLESFVGEYTASMEMVGAHLTILRLDEELKSLLDAPTDAPAWHSWS